jgi:hypothetical protein
VAGFAEAEVRLPPGERPEVDAAGVEVALGVEIRVRIPVAAPAELACAVFKACYGSAFGRGVMGDGCRKSNAYRRFLTWRNSGSG